MTLGKKKPYAKGAVCPFAGRPYRFPPHTPPKTSCYLLKEKITELFLQKVIRRLVKKEVIPMKRIWIVFLALALLVLAGCCEKEPIAFSESKESRPLSVEVPVQSTEPDESTMFQQRLTESEDTAEEAVEAKTTEYVPAFSDIASDEKEAPSVNPPSSQPVEKPAEAADQGTVSQNEPEPIQEQEEPPAEEEQNPVVTEDPPTEPETPQEQPSEPDFNIGYWISYAKGVAAEKGLDLDPSAVDCWDNPITANPDCIYLERDINARLSRYAGDEDITAVWIWYESIGTNKYLIYIGYA